MVKIIIRSFSQWVCSFGRTSEREAAYSVLGDYEYLAHRRPRLSAHFLLLAIVLFFIVFLVWSAHAPLDEVARGFGRVIPSSQIQVVQNLEGGILDEILIQEGDNVSRGQVLLRLDKVTFDSVLREKRSEYLDLLASVARLTAEVSGEGIRFSDLVRNEAPGLIQSEISFQKARKAQLESSIQILRRQAEQRQHEIAELESQLGHLKQSYALAQEEFGITAPMVEEGATSKVELLRLKRELSNLEGHISQATLAIPRAQMAYEEARRRIEEESERFRSQVLEELKEKNMHLAALAEIMPALEDRLGRTDVRSPVDGTVKQLRVTTLGGVVSPGMALVEIVPKEDNLLVAAKVLPADIAFIHPDQRATVKLTAYDFSIYGGLAGTVEHISADSILDEDGQSYYLIRVRTNQKSLQNGGRDLPIMPGMVAQVDILTGKKTVMDYLLKPLLKAKQSALRER